MQSNYKKAFLGSFFISSLVLVSIWYFKMENRSLAFKSEGSEMIITPDQRPKTMRLPGKIIFQSNRDGDEDIYVMNPDGSDLVKLMDNNAFDGYPVWSPDGSKIAFESNRDGNFQIYIVDHDKKGQISVTDASFNNRSPSWSSDGKRIAYESERDKGLEIYVIDLQSKKERMLTDTMYKSILPDWSPDGNKIAFTRNRLGWGVYVMNSDGTDIKPLDTEGGSCRPRWSPDGKKIAYVSQKADGKGDVWIMNADGSNRHRLTADSHNYDYYPSWSPDGRWIVYATSPDKKDWELRIIDTISRDVMQIPPIQGRYPDWQ